MNIGVLSNLYSTWILPPSPPPHPARVWLLSRCGLKHCLLLLLRNKEKTSIQWLKALCPGNFCFWVTTVRKLSLKTQMLPENKSKISSNFLKRENKP